MPRYSHPAGADDIVAAVAAFGSPAKVAIIRHLRAHAESNAGAIGEATGLARTTVVDALRALEDGGVVTSTPAPAGRGRGAFTTYALDQAQAGRLYAALGHALGVSSACQNLGAVS